MHKTRVITTRARYRTLLTPQKASSGPEVIFNCLFLHFWNKPARECSPSENTEFLCFLLALLYGPSLGLGVP